MQPLLTVIYGDDKAIRAKSVTVGGVEYTPNEDSFNSLLSVLNTTEERYIGIEDVFDDLVILDVFSLHAVWLVRSVVREQ